MIDLDHPSHYTLIPLEQKSLALTSAFAYAEYVAAYVDSASILANRWSEVRISADDQLYLSDYPDWLHLLAVVEVDSPDTNILLPLLARLTQATTRMSLHILTTDDDLTLLDGLLDDVDLLDDEADLDFPMLFFFDEEWECQESWGPRPQVADGYLDEWMAQHPEAVRLMEMDDDEIGDAQEAELIELTEQLFHEMRMWYVGEADQATITEIRAVLTSLTSDDSDEDEESEA